MNIWQACFRLEKGHAYRIKYVVPGEDRVREGTYRFDGDVLPGNRAVVVMMPDDTTSPAGSIHILEVDEQRAPAQVKR